MKKFALILLTILPLLTSCGQYTKILQTSDYEFKYEAAKAYYTDGHYRRAAELFGGLLALMKGTQYGEECLFMLGQSNFMAKDYESANSFFQKYYQSYPRGQYVEMARFQAAYSLYKQTADIRLDQTSTMDAITEFSTFLEYYPNTKLKPQAQQMVYTLQDKLVDKEFEAAKLYFDLGNYMVNCLYGGSNYEACVVTAQNALKDYPYASPDRREALSILILRAKYELARQSVEEKRVDRFRDIIDEYYAFKNDFPESKHIKEATRLFADAESIVKRKNINISEE